MRDGLDELLQSLAQAGPDAPLDGMEAAVMAGVARRRAEARAMARLAPVQAGAVALALVVGIAGGRLAAGSGPQAEGGGSPLYAGLALAPSTLLGGEG